MLGISRYFKWSKKQKQKKCDFSFLQKALIFFTYQQLNIAFVNEAHFQFNFVINLKVPGWPGSCDHIF